MRKQQPMDVLAETVSRERRIRRHTFRVMEVTALVDTCGHFVTLIDQHHVGAAIFLCIVALATAGAVVVALVTHRVDVLV